MTGRSLSLHARPFGRVVALLAAATLLLCAACGANPLESVLADFESGGTHGAVAVDLTNSPSSGPSNSVIDNVSESGSARLRLMDSDGANNGACITFTGALPQPGYYLITADIKVDNASAAIGSFGMAAVAGGPVTAEISDANAGYVMNLTGSGDAGLGYQAIGASINVSADGSFPKDLTLYFSTNPSGNNYNAPANDGTFLNTHRSTAVSWPADSSNAVYVDNIKRFGPGNFGEERHLWISVGDSFTNRTNLENALVGAKNNNFNCVDILARYRADAYYIPNRTDSTYANPEPLGTRIGGTAVTAANDPLQYAIDRGHELGLKVYISFGCFMVVPTTGSYPAFLPSGSIMWYYNGGSPRAMTASDPSAEGLWADPGLASVRDYTRTVLMDVVSNYDIDGVVFDRIRYPSYYYSYNPASLAEMGISGTPAYNDATFRNARREAIATFLHDAYESVTTLKPWVVVGTSPIAFSNALTDTYNSVMQFWPKWTSRPTGNRVISFGCCDVFQPQFYRLYSSSPAGPVANATLMQKALFGDLAVYSLDCGLMPGGLGCVAPTLYHPTSPDTSQSMCNAQNITDSRNIGLNGFGIFAATKTLADINKIRDPNASSAGVDVLASPTAPNDYLFKAGYDNVKPNAVTNLQAIPNADGTVDLTWNTPAAASDGETPSRYLLYKSDTTPVKEYRANEVTHSVIPGAAVSYVVPTDFAGSYYFRIVPVDDYNNHGPAVEIGPVTVAGEPVPPADIIVDNPAAVFTGAWSTGTSSADKYGTNYHYRTPSTGANTAAFTATIPTDGTWRVHEWHCAGTNRATNARHTIQYSSGSSVATVNQTANGGKWNSLGTFPMPAGSASTVTIDDYCSGSVVIADAMRWEYVVEASAAPSGLAAAPHSQTEIDLTWADNSSNERNFIVARSNTSGGPYTDIAALGINVTSYRDFGLNANTTYYYVVRSQNSGGTSADSNEASATTLPVPPAAPSNLTAQVISQTQINLAWTDNSSNETNFVVARSTTSGGPYTDIATLGANTTSYSNTGLTAGTTYYYVVRATNAGGASANSNQASATTIPNAPAAPSNLAATATPTQINLTWTDNSSNETNFVVARSATSGGPYTDIATLGANTTAYSDTGLVPNLTRYYVVRATNAGGASANSNQAGASTPIPDIIVDNPSATFEGTWFVGTSSTDKYGADYKYATSGSGAKATYSANAPAAGTYRVQVWHPAGTNRANNAPHGVNFNSGSLTYAVNQQVNGGTWVTLGAHYFAQGYGSVIINTTGANPSVVMADAVRFTWMNSATPVTLTFDSVSGDDGWVKESTPTSEVGGSLNSSNTTLAVGDESTRKQFKSILSFDTASIPDGATIQKVTLRVTQYSINGGDPWASLGSLVVDIKSPYFGTAATLQNADFENAPTASWVASVPKPSGNQVPTDVLLNSSAVFATSKTAKTQLKLRFTTGDDGDSANDYVNFYSGNYSTNTSYRPKLIVEYAQ